MITCSLIFKRYQINQCVKPELLSEFILTLHSHLFYPHFKEDYKKKRQYLTFSKSDFEKSPQVKTIFKRSVPILTFRSSDFFLYAINNLNPDETIDYLCEAIDYLFIKLCVKFLKKIGLSKAERKIFFKTLLLKLFMEALIEQARGNLPHA